MVSDNSSTENQNTHYRFNNFFPENRAVYEVMWKNTVQPDRPEKKIWRIYTACWISMATNTRSEYVIITVFLRQQSLHDPPLNVTLHAHCQSFFYFGWRYRCAGKNLSLRCCHIQISGHSYVHIHKRLACLGSEPRYSATGQTFVSILAWELDI
jgi:hypothetical protein